MDPYNPGEKLPSFMTQTDLCGIKWFQALRNVKAITSAMISTQKQTY